MQYATKIILSLNATGFALSALFKTEKLTDLFGSSTFAITTYALYKRAPHHSRFNKFLTGAICLWSARLAGFLAYRAAQHGDERLRKFLPAEGKGWGDKSILPLAGFWSLQSLWPIVLLSPIAVVLQSQVKHQMTPVRWLALSGMIAAVVVESVADVQKYRYKASHGGVYKDGLYGVVRYPNYTAEIFFWMCAGLYTFSALKGGKKALAVLAPGFIATLIVFVSGIPLTEKKRDEVYGDDEDYIHYTRSVPDKLIPYLY
eukprot:TRINITY_DN6997_c0_g1_i1.p1 TRINITY_DN6997_c0_g1~~TRINITY_DN6997_c0_g1_i1.p1  ORF type:complete len:288 (-),score=18.14 TRINITY_DN6997_c0_g1_i1:29-805(-)